MSEGLCPPERYLYTSASVVLHQRHERVAFRLFFNGMDGAFIERDEVLPLRRCCEGIPCRFSDRRTEC